MNTFDINDNSKIFMGLALELAKSAYENDEVPVGAVIVQRRNSEVLAAFSNQMRAQTSAIAHAEILAIQKATEIGVSKIIPCITEYTNIKNINEKNLSQNTVEASEQSLRLDIPSIEKEIDLKSLLESWPMDRKLIYCNEKNTDNTSIIETMISIKNTTKKWAVLVGPEGGFSSAEQDLILKNNNVISVSLGKTILRSDTAITVALFCIKEITS